MEAYKDSPISFSTPTVEYTDAATVGGAVKALEAGPANSSKTGSTRKDKHSKKTERQVETTPSKVEEAHEADSNKNLDKKSAGLNLRSPLGTASAQTDGKKAAIGAQATLNQLPFKSYRTGTLMTNNFVPTGQYAQPPEPSPTVKSSALSATSAVFVPQKKLPEGGGAYLESPAASGSSSPQIALAKLKSLIKAMPPPVSNHNGSTFSRGPTPVTQGPFYVREIPAEQVQLIQGPTERRYLARADPFKKDILITVDSIVHNIERVMEIVTVDGLVDRIATDEFEVGKYNVIDALHRMSEAEKEDFWFKNWIEITLDFGDGVGTIESTNNKGELVTKVKKSVVDSLLKFDQGTGMRKYAKSIFISIKCPLQPKQDVTVRALTQVQQRCPEFREIVDIVTEINKFEMLTKIECILMNKSGNRSPLTFEQLNYAIPFYDCVYEDWSLMWQTEFMTYPEAVSAWPISYLDREMHKVHQARERDFQMAKRAHIRGSEESSAFQSQLETVSQYTKNDPRGHTYEHRLEAEDEPIRPLSYYHHP